MFPLRAYRYNSSLRAKSTCSIASAAQTRAAFPLWELRITQFTPGPTCLSSTKLGDREERAAAVGYRGKRVSWAEPTDQTSAGSTKVISQSCKTTAAQTLQRTERAYAETRNWRRKRRRATGQRSPCTRQLCQSTLSCESRTSICPTWMGAVLLRRQHHQRRACTPVLSVFSHSRELAVLN